VIGTGGKVIQEIQRTTGTTVTIEQVGHEGVVVIYAQDKEALDKAATQIQEIVAEPEVGKIYPARVKILKEAGAVVEFMRGKEGFLHISEIMPYRIEKVEDVLQIGQELDVKYMGIDARTGKHRVSHKAVMNGEASETKPFAERSHLRSPRRRGRSKPASHSPHKTRRRE
jgi:polyribonucleotide nucleotidyltransferase